MDNTNDPQIVKTSTPTDSEELLAGLPDGHVIETPEDQPNEKIVYDKDKDGAIIGWHKEQVNG